MTNNTDSIIRKSTTREPGNPGEFGTHDHSAPEASLADPAPRSSSELRVALLGKAVEEGRLLTEAEVESIEATRRAEDLKWGETGVHNGSRTPWGIADNVERVAPGVDYASTPGHGGYKLSPARNRVIPAALRRSSGWYEHDDDWWIAARYLPEAFPQVDPDEAERHVMNYYPDKWEKANGRKLQPGQSEERDQADWTASHAGDFVVVSANYVENDMVKVLARKADWTQAEFLIPKSEYRSYADRQKSGELGQAGRFVVDPSRYEQLPEQPPAVKTPTRRYGLEAVRKGKTLAAQAKIDHDLNRRWRDGDKVQTLKQILETDGISGKSVVLQNGKRSYSLSQKQFTDDSSYSVLPVSKAMWEAIEAPDERTPRTIAYQAKEIAHQAVEAARGFEDKKRAMARYRQANDEYEAAIAAETEQ